MNNQSFDNLVKQKTNEHEAPVPPGVWEAIIKEKKKRRYPVFWWITGLVLVLLTVGIGILYKVGGNHYATADQITAVNPKTNTYPKENNNGTASAIPAIINVYTDTMAVDRMESSNAPTVLSAQQHIAKAHLHVANDSFPVKEDQSSDARDRNSTTIPALSNPDNSSRLSRPLLPQSSAASSTGISQRNNTVLTGRKGISVKNNRSGLLNNAVAGSTVFPSSFIRENASDDTTSAATKDLSGIPGENSYLLLSKNLQNLLSGSKLLQHSAIVQLPVIADSIIEPDIPMIKKIRTDQSGWSIDISVIPFQPVQQKQSLLSLTRTTIDNMHTTEYKPDHVQASLKPALAYNIGINKKINKHIVIGAGLQYAMIKEHITLSGKETNTFYQVVQRLDNSGGSPVLRDDTVASVTSGTRVIDAINSYRLLEIPLAIQYILGEQSSWSFRLNGGMQLGIAARYHNSINGKLVPVYSSGSHAGNSPAMRIGFFAGVRVTNRLTKKYHVFAAPYFRFSTGNYNTIINSKPIHQAGIAFGISYQIGR
jgi:hypothetical protein